MAHDTGELQQLATDNSKCRFNYKRCCTVNC